MTNPIYIARPPCGCGCGLRRFYNCIYATKALTVREYENFCFKFTTTFTVNYSMLSPQLDLNNYS